MRWIVFMVCMFTAGGCAGPRSTGNSGGFEPGDLVDGVPVGWSGSTSSPELTIAGVDRTRVHSGKASFAFESKSYDDLTSFKQVVDASPYAGKRVRYRAYVRTHHLTDHAGLWMRADSEKRNAIVFDNMEDRPIKGSNEWRMYEIVLLIPAGAETLHFGVLLQGAGQVWVDDCSLEVVGDDVWLTAHGGPGYSKRRPSRDRVLHYPANLGFEGR